MVCLSLLDSCDHLVFLCFSVFIYERGIRVWQGLSGLINMKCSTQNLAHSRRSIKVSYDLLSTYYMLGLGLGFGDKQHKALVLVLFHPARGETTNVNRTIQFSCSVMSDSLQPHELQQARLPCPSPSPGVCSPHAH